MLSKELTKESVADALLDTGSKRHETIAIRKRFNKKRFVARI